MTTLPIIGRELRVSSRKRATHLSRLIVGCAAAIVVVWLLLVSGAALPPQRLGMALFTSLSNLAFIACLLPGVLLTADCLSEEKRDGTLGLLFLTDLKGFDVVFGKFFAASVNALYALCASFPILAIPLVLGGVTGGEVARMVLVLANTAFFSLAVGLVVSSVSVKERRAITTTILLLFTVGLALHYVGGPGRFLSPRLAYEYAYESQFITHARGFFYSCLWVNVVSWLLLAWAGWLLPQMIEEKCPAPEVQEDTAATLWPDRDAVTGEMIGLGRKPVGDGNPIEWLAERDGRTSFWMWVALAFSGMGWLTVHPMFNSRLGGFEVAMVAGMAFHAMLVIWVAWDACGRFGSDRRCGALEVLLSTPLTTMDILKGQLLSMFRLFMAPILAVLALDMALVVTSLQIRGGSPVAQSLVFAQMALVIIFLLNISCAAVLGLWRGLRGRRTSAATLQTVLRVLVVPTVAWVIVGFGHTSPYAGGPRRDPGFWLLISAINALFFLVTAWIRLRDDFRELATQHALDASDASPSLKADESRLPSVAAAHGVRA